MVSDAYKGNVAMELFRKRYRQPLYLERNRDMVLLQHERKRKQMQQQQPQQQQPQQQLAPNVQSPDIVTPILRTPEPELELRQRDVSGQQQERYAFEGSRRSRRKRGIEEIVFEIKAQLGSIARPPAIMRFDALRIGTDSGLDGNNGEIIQGSGSAPEQQQGRLEEPIRCKFELSIFQDDNGPNGAQQELIKYSEQCTITVDPENRGVAKIELDDAFYIKEASLRVMKTFPTKCFTMANKYLTTVRIICIDGDVPEWPPLPLYRENPPPDVEEDVSDLKYDRELVAMLDTLPVCPPRGHRLEIRSTVPSGQLVTTDLRLEIDCGWNNKHSYVVPRPAVPRLPTPVSEYANDDVTLRYFFSAAVRDFDQSDDSKRYKEKKVYELSCVRCPLCDGKKRYPSFEWLHFHLIVTHPLFTWTVKKKTHNSCDIHVDASREIEKATSKTKGSKRDDPLLNFFWHANPTRPFNLEEYLAGDRSWTDGKAAPPLAKKPAVAAMRSVRRTGEVLEIPPLVKKRWKVPERADGLKFVRSRSKRWIEPGEELSESDGDVEEDWLIQRHRETIDDYSDVAKFEKNQMKRWARHVFEERPIGFCHFPASLVRFVRHNLNWIRTGSNGVEFWKFASACVKNGLVDMPTFKHCLTLVKGEHWSSYGRTDADIGFAIFEIEKERAIVIPNTQTSGAIELDDEQQQNGDERMDIDSNKDANSAANAVANELSKLQVADDEAPPKPSAPRYCICDAKTWRRRDMVACANNACTKNWFHMNCIGLTKRPDMNWTCPECS